jgi:hypothetical protein
MEYNNLNILHVRTYQTHLEVTMHHLQMVQVLQAL